MTYGILGPSGSGKSRFAAVFAKSISNTFNIPLYSTNSIIGSQKILYYDDILELKNCVFVWDEIDNDLQGRNFKKNIEKKELILQWFKQCRKKDIILIWNTQFARQFDVIGRENTHVIIYANNFGLYSEYKFYNTETGKWGKTIKADLSQYSNLYNFKEYQHELSWREKPSFYHKKSTEKNYIDKSKILKFENIESLSGI